MDSIWNEIKRIAEENSGFIKTSAVEAAGISRPMLRKYVEDGKLEQVRKGLYVRADDLADEFAMVQLQSSKAIFSYGTALYLWGLSDRTPHRFDITVPQGTNISRFKRDNPTIRCHYVQPEVYDVGITEIQSPQGAIVRLYDKERCICDLIMNRNKYEVQVFQTAIKEYMSSKDKKLSQLIVYADMMGIRDEVMKYVEVLV